MALNQVPVGQENDSYSKKRALLDRAAQPMERARGKKVQQTSARTQRQAAIRLREIGIDPGILKADLSEDALLARYADEIQGEGLVAAAAADQQKELMDAHGVATPTEAEGVMEYSDRGLGDLTDALLAEASSRNGQRFRKVLVK